MEKELDTIVNKVEMSGLVNIDLSSFRPIGKRKCIDIKSFLYEELILREKEFRKLVDEMDVSSYQDCFVGIYCSNDAIIPNWAYMLLVKKLNTVSKHIYLANEIELESILYRKEIEKFDFSIYQNKRILVNGCADVYIAPSAFVEITQKLIPFAQSIMFGEACSAVPVYKKKA
jgi:hypothetical protein